MASRPRGSPNVACAFAYSELHSFASLLYPYLHIWLVKLFALSSDYNHMVIKHMVVDALSQRNGRRHASEGVFGAQFCALSSGSTHACAPD